MSVHDNRRVRVSHARPAFQHRVVLIDHGAHDRADVERLLALLVDLVREDVPDAVEVAARVNVRIAAHITVERVAALGPPREAFPWGDIGVLIVGEQRAARRGEVGGPVLGLSVRTHDPVVSAYPEVVLG